MISSQGRKKSNFPALSAIPDGATLDFVSGSTNYKITKADFITAMGATGSLVADGSASRTDILQASGSVYTIRGLEDGNGIVCSVSAENGVNIAIDMTQEGTYTPLVDTFATATPTFASLKGGAGIDISKSANVITISSTGETPHGLLTLTGNAVATTIGSAGTAVLAAGTWVGGTTDNFSASTGGRLTYTGAPTADITIDASITFRSASANEVDVAAILYKNGAAVTASKRVTSCTGSASGAVSMPYIIEMAQNDYLELYIANEETADDLTVTDAMFRAVTGAAAGPGQAAIGAAVAAGPWQVAVPAAAITAVTNIDVTGLEAGYDYLFRFQGAIPAGDGAALEMRFSQSGVFLSGAGEYNDGSASTSLSLTNGIGNVSTEGFGADVSFHNPNSASTKKRAWVAGQNSSISGAAVGIATNKGGHLALNLDAVDGVRFFWDDAGAWQAVGTLTVYRQKRS